MPSQPRTYQPRYGANTSAEQGRQRRPALKHPGVCAGCGGATTLPFKPTPERLGYCSVCFVDRKQSSPRILVPKRTDSVIGGRSSPAQQAEELHPEVFPGLDLQPRTRSTLSHMGITSPTSIQEQAIPWLSAGRDVIGQAQTGSGKTLAFGIPLVESCSRPGEGVQGLVLVPTRELAIQVASVLEAVSGHRVSITLLYGGRALGGEKRALQKGARIVVGTPGRTLDHLRQGNLSLRSLCTLVLDEADEMLDRGFARDVESILAETPADRQTVMFSATLPDWVARTSHKHLRNPKTVRVIADEADALKIEHLIYKMNTETKMQALRTLLDQRGDAPILVFGKTKHGVKKLALQLERLGYPVTALQGNLSQNARERAMETFRSGATPVLVATNVAARGLDVDGISQVINYDLPDSLQLFTHRVGRTGRMGKSGEAITFVTPDDEAKWREIERGLDKKIAIRRWGPDGPGDAGHSRSSAPAATATRDSRPSLASPVERAPRPGNRRRGGPPRGGPVSRTTSTPSADTSAPARARFRR